MLIEQIIKLKLRGSGLSGRICTPITGYFHDKTKISTKNLRVVIISAKLLQEAMYFTFPYLGQITYKI